MKNILFNTLLMLTIAALSYKSYAQTPVRANSVQPHAWAYTMNTIKIKGKWSLYIDVMARRANFFEKGQQWITHTGFLYQYRENMQLGFGYAGSMNYPYGDFPIKNTFIEHRAWEQVLFKQEIDKSKLFHRIRLEERWFGNSTTGNIDTPRYETRVRYMFRVNEPLGEIMHKKVYLNMYDELFMNFGSNVGRNIFDQNRLGFNIGLGITKNINLEVGYMYQIIQLRSLNALSQNLIENNHTFMCGIVTNF